MLAFEGWSIGVDPGDRHLDIGQPVLCRSGHNAMAWLRADSETPSLRRSSQATSTGISSNCSNSNRIPDNRDSRLPDPSGVRSSSRSTSLSGPAVPRAIDPNNRGLLAPYRASTSLISFRCSRSRVNASSLARLVIVRILRTFADNPAALVTANWETKRPGFLLTASTPLTFPRVFSRRLTYFRVVRCGVSLVQAVFQSVSDSRQLHH